MAGKITTILVKKEAETYCSHGLHKEALDIYKKSPKVYLEWKHKSLGERLP